MNNLADYLGKLVNSYRLIIGGAAELNHIALSKKKQVEDALDMADDLGEIIEAVIKTMNCFEVNYFDYCKVKAQLFKLKNSINNIQTEIDEDLRFEDSEK